MSSIPLVVDLDGTLIHTDMLHESAIRLFRDKPFQIRHIPGWLSCGKAQLKEELASRTAFDPSALPYNDNLIDWLRSQRENGREVILCTASDTAIATRISEYLGCFDDVMASDGNTNLSADQKAVALESRYGRGGFDYAGNSARDLPVWKASHKAVVVNASPEVEKQAAECCKIERVFPPPAVTLNTWSQVLRVHQWLKNLLVFIPLLAAHQYANLDGWLTCILAFISFSLCASSVYIANDLFDLESDRHHARKRHRPFTSGHVPAWKGVVLAPVLVLLSVMLAVFVGAQFLSWLLIYFIVTCAYSWWLKRQILVDCLSLAVLYTLRVIAGAAAAGLSLTFWLLAFSVFLFLSLAFVKRYSELAEQVNLGKPEVHGRGYTASDTPIVQIMGISSGYTAVLVLALYLNSDAVLKLYNTPELAWGGVLIMLYWISRMWMQAHRGNMHDDPLIFAIEDRGSLIAGAAFAAVMLLSTVKWS